MHLHFFPSLLYHIPPSFFHVCFVWLWEQVTAFLVLINLHPFLAGIVYNLYWLNFFSFYFLDTLSLPFFILLFFFLHFHFYSFPFSAFYHCITSPFISLFISCIFHFLSLSPSLPTIFLSIFFSHCFVSHWLNERKRDMLHESKYIGL